MVDVDLKSGVMKQPKFTETLFDLETAIAMHLENMRNDLNQIDNPALVKALEIDIKVFETAPRNSTRLEGRIAVRKQEMDYMIDTFKCQELCIEIQSLERLLAMVRMHQRGEALDGMAY